MTEDDLKSAFASLDGDLTAYETLKAELQGWISDDKFKNLPLLLKAIRISGVIDFIDEADRHAAVTRLFTNLMLTNEDREIWQGRDLGKNYETLSRTLAGLEPNQIRNAGVRTLAPVHALTWCAFADGQFLENPRPGWPGVLDKDRSRTWNINRWIHNGGAGVTPQTPYSEYIDHMYDQLERRFEAIDIVFTDLVTLSDLWDRRLILELPEDPPHATELRQMDLSRLARLGRLVTINFHIAAAAHHLLDETAPRMRVGKDEESQTGRMRAAIRTLVDKGDASAVLSLNALDDRPQPDEPLGSDPFSPPLAWLDHLEPRTTRAASAMDVGQVFRQFWRLDRKLELPAHSDHPLHDPRLAKMGPNAPVAPIQLAAGPHATYTAFAYFANCSPHVSGIVERTLLNPSEHANLFFRPAGDDRLNSPNPAGRMNYADVSRRLRGADRGDRLLLMPSEDELIERAILFFNFLWQFVPATALCYDHVASAFARAGPYEKNWFDACLPVEAALFHSDDWHSATRFSDQPARLSNGPLSCLGGFSFAISRRAFDQRRAIDAVEDLRKNFWGSLDKSPNHLYYRLKPAFDQPAWQKIKGSAVRPNLSYWATIDEMLSDTLRLYSVSLFIARALNAHCKALIRRSDATKYADAKELTREALLDRLGSESDLDEGFLQFLQAKTRITMVDLFDEIRGRSDNKVVENLITVLGRLCLSGQHFSTAPEGFEESVRANLGSLMADSDYISGILQSCGTLADYAQHFVATVVSKINSMASSKHWAVFHVDG